ncbi:MAG: FtsQ-type POTRA domain-containing protein [bacterium]
MKKRSPILRKKNVKKEARQRRLRLLGGILLGCAAIAGLFYGGGKVLTRFDFFALQKIVVTGAPKSLSEAEIIQRSGVQLGTNLFKINMKDVQFRLQQHPYFKFVSVQRQIPHTLVLEIREHLPEFVLNTGRLYYVDREGEIFKDITDSEDSRDLPVLSGFTDESILTDPQGSRQAMRAAAELQSLFKAASFAEQLGLSEIHYEKNIGFTLYPEKKKYSIKMGLKDFPEKIRKFQEIWEKVQNSNARISSIDLNYPGKVLMTL